MTLANEGGLWSSWNGRIKHPYKKGAVPHSVQELQALVRESEGLRVVGTGVSSSDISAGTSTLVDLSSFDRIGPLIEAEGQTRVRVEAGVRLKDLVAWLEERGWELEDLPDIAGVTLGGAVATGTHGTGREARGLSDLVTAVELVDGLGQLRRLEPGEELDAFRVSLGLMGVTLALELEVRPLRYFALSEQAWPNDRIFEQYPSFVQQYEYFRVLFLPNCKRSWVICGSSVDAAEHRRAGAPLAPPTQAPPPWISKRRSSSQALYRRAGLSTKRIARSNRILQRLFFSHRSSSFGSLGTTTVTASRPGSMVLAEWSLALDRFDLVYRALQNSLHGSAWFGPAPKLAIHLPMDLRYVRASRAWLSPYQGQASVCMGCVCRIPELADSYEAFNTLQELFFAQGGRSHWAKHQTLTRTDLKSLYPRYEDFVQLRRRFDPEGRFLNAWLRERFE